VKIKKLTARFGTLDNAILELGDGLNIITAGNESGKSTWCDFIRAMLYGVDSAQRPRAGVLPEKTLRAPWSGAAPEGSMDLDIDGQAVTLRRASRSVHAPLKQFSAVYTGTEEPYPLTGTEAGEKLTGVTRDVFSRSAFIAQSGARIENSPDLEKRIDAIVSTGTEGLSYSDADDRLKVWQRERHYNARIGANAELNARLAETETRLREIRQVYEAAQSRRDALAALEAEVRRSQAAQPDTFDDLTERLAAAEAREEKLQNELERGLFGARDDRTVALELDRVKAECAACAETAAKTYSHEKLIAPAILLLATAGLAYSHYIDWRLTALPGALLLVLAALSFANAAGVKKAARDASAKRRALLRQYGAADEAGLDALLAEHRALYAQYTAVQAEGRELSRVLAGRQRAETQRVAAQIAAERSLADQRTELAALEGKLSVLGDAPALLAERARIRADIAENIRQARNISLAREMLEQAQHALFADFSPRLTERATELFTRLTAGRYDSLALDRALNVAARRAGDTLGHDSAYLSEGARTLLYLSLRLAICELALPQDKNLPLILDDALNTLDDTRCAAVLELLCTLAEKRQILLFTCHGRERAMMAHRQGITFPEVH